MMILWLPFLFLVPLAMFWVMRSGNGGAMGCCGMDHSSASQTSSAGSPGPDPMDIARQRLARGEITSIEFDVIRRAIG